MMTFILTPSLSHTPNALAPRTRKVIRGFTVADVLSPSPVEVLQHELDLI